MKKLIIFIVIVIVLGAGVWYFIANKPEATNPNNNQIVGGDKDEHGCIGSAGYTWCANKSKCLRVWEENCYDNMEQQIQYLLSQKYEKLMTDIVLKTTKKNDNYAVGSISFLMNGQAGEGGMFMTAKKNNVWTLVYDGNGSIDCVSIKENYQFPAEMLVNFCD